MSGCDCAATVTGRCYYCIDQDTINRLTEERDALRAELKLMEHKVITCGVAASHSNANLTRTGAYAEKWDSPQAEAVRKLREQRDALLAACEALMTWIDNWSPSFTEDAEWPADRDAARAAIAKAKGDK